MRVRCAGGPPAQQQQQPASSQPRSATARQATRRVCHSGASTRVFFCIFQAYARLAYSRVADTYGVALRPTQPISHRSAKQDVQPTNAACTTTPHFYSFAGSAVEGPNEANPRPEGSLLQPCTGVSSARTTQQTLSPKRHDTDVPTRPPLRIAVSRSRSCSPPPPLPVGGSSP